MKVGDQLTIDGKLVEVTYVMNEKAFGYKFVEEAPVKEVEIKEEVKEEAPKRTRRKKA